MLTGKVLLNLVGNDRPPARRIVHPINEQVGVAVRGFAICFCGVRERCLLPMHDVVFRRYLFAEPLPNNVVDARAVCLAVVHLAEIILQEEW